METPRLIKKESKTRIPGRMYFIDSTSLRSQWGDPYYHKDGTPDPDWEVYFSSRKKKPFYYNQKTKVRQWKNPFFKKEEQILIFPYKIEWIKKKGEWTLKDSGKEMHSGKYELNPDTLEIKTTLVDVKSDKKGIPYVRDSVSTVINTKCLVRFTDYNDSIDSSFKGKIEIINSNVSNEINSVKQDDVRSKMFVLHAQLNGAEYQSEKDESIVTEVQSYKKDVVTEGPIGQLLCDPGIAQFIIDNAHNSHTAGKGINNVKQMGEMKDIVLKNGYLQIGEHPDIEGFKANLPNMTILGVKDVMNSGLINDFFNHPERYNKVDIVYASAVPYGCYNNKKTEDVRIIANLTLFAQYTGSMRLAIERGNCDLYITKVGGSIFGHTFEDVKKALMNAYDLMKPHLDKANVKIYFITRKSDPEEFKIFST
jgi:hypothetical protein